MSNQHSGFGKVHEKMFSSSIMRTPVETRWVFVFLFSSCGSDGRYAGDSFAIARHAAVSEEAAKSALEELAAPDPNSSSPEFEGRRIRDVSDGQTGSLWLVLQHKKYRAKRDPAERAAYNAAYYQGKTKEKRARVKQSRGLSPVQASQKTDPETELLPTPGPKHPGAQPSGVNVSSGVRQIKPIAEALKRERGDALAGGSFQTGTPPLVEWMDYARKTFPSWPEPDILSSFDDVEAKGWPRGDWHACCRKYHTAHLRHAEAATKKLSRVGHGDPSVLADMQRAKAKAKESTSPPRQPEPRA